MDIQLPIFIEDVIVGEGRRELDRSAVNRLAESIEQIGLRHPITVREKNGKYQLIAGRHRLEACRKLGREHVPAIIVKMTNDEARLWEIAENLHRANLNNIEKAEQIDEWRELTAKMSNRLTTGGRVHPADVGIRKTAEALNVSHETVANAKKIASIAPEAKAAAQEAGVDTIRELTQIAKAEPERQVAVVHELAERRTSKVDGDVKVRAAHAVAELIAEHVPGAAWDALKANLYAAGAANIANALTNITGEAIMDSRYGA